MRTRDEPWVGTWLAWLRRVKPERHLTDSELAVLARPDELPSAARAAAAHAGRCADCRARIAETGTALSRMSGALEPLFNAAIPPPRLAAQRHRILRRLQRMTGNPCPARILRFPTIGPPAIRHAEIARRWAVTAAVAGATIGIALVHPGDLWQMHQEPDAARIVTANTGPEGRQSTLSDEQFMLELEAALATRRVPPLIALDEMTPRLRAASTDIR